MTEIRYRSGTIIPTVDAAGKASVRRASVEAQQRRSNMYKSILEAMETRIAARVSSHAIANWRTTAGLYTWSFTALDAVESFYRILDGGHSFRALSGLFDGIRVEAHHGEAAVVYCIFVDAEPGCGKSWTIAALSASRDCEWDFPRLPSNLTCSAFRLPERSSPAECTSRLALSVFEEMQPRYWKGFRLPAYVGSPSKPDLSAMAGAVSDAEESPADGLSSARLGRLFLSGTRKRELATKCDFPGDMREGQMLLESPTDEIATPMGGELSASRLGRLFLSGGRKPSMNQ